MAIPGVGSDFFELNVGELGPSLEPFARSSSAAAAEDANELLWAAIERLPSHRQTNFAIIRRGGSTDAGNMEAVDVRKLDRQHRELVVSKALATNEQDNYNLVSGIRERLTRVGLDVPKVEVRFQNLNVRADVHIGRRALPTLPNYMLDVIEHCLATLRMWRSKKSKLTILNDINGVIKPGRMTLLLGPPGSGKSTLLLVLAGKLDSKLQAWAYEHLAIPRMQVRLMAEPTVRLARWKTRLHQTLPATTREAEEQLSLLRGDQIRWRPYEGFADAPWITVEDRQLFDREIWLIYFSAVELLRLSVSRRSLGFHQDPVVELTTGTVSRVSCGQKGVTNWWSRYQAEVAD